MANFCLRPELVDKFKKGIFSGEINPEKLNVMPSKERRDFFAKYVGEENAQNVNALFESKLLLKNQQAGLIRWAEKVMNNQPTLRKGLIDRISKMENVLTPQEEAGFLEDLATQKLGIGVTEEEAKNILKFSKATDELKAKIPNDSPIGSTERMEYGVALVQYKNYIASLKEGAEKLTWGEWLKSPSTMAKEAAGAAKSAKATLDNSFFGRQGIKILFTKPSIWGKNFLKSWGDIGKELRGIDAMDAIKADIFSRPNALNDNYSLSKLDIGIETEEAFPSQVWEKVPGLSRLFKASESAYNGAGLRMRADLADAMFDKAKNAGVSLKDKTEMEAIGQLVNAMTGRGKLKTIGQGAETLNVALFSPKFLRSNFDTITAHIFQPSMKGTFAKKEASKNLGKIVMGMAGVLGAAEVLFPGSVEFDPRSSDFGKIKIGNTKFDITGGMGSIAVLAARSITRTTKTSSGVKRSLVSGDYGAQTGLDVIEQFFEGKLAPGPALIRDILKGETFSGENPLDPKVMAKSLLVPIPITTYQQLRDDPNSANDLFAILADGLGFSTSTSAIGRNDWNTSDTKELKQFKEKVGQETFDKENENYNVAIKERLEKLKATKEYQSLSEEDKAAEITRKKTDVKDEIFKKYNFKVKKEKPRKEIKLD